MARGIFSFEAMASILLMVLTVAVLLFAFKLQAGSVEAQLSLLEREGLAMMMATHLLGACAQDGGFAECGNGEAALGIIGKKGLEEFSLLEARERFSLKPETELRVEVNGIEGHAYLGKGETGNSEGKRKWLCVKRIALLAGKEMQEVLLAVCVWHQAGKGG